MPVWVWIALAVGATLLVAALVAIAAWTWRGVSRRYLEQLTGRAKEAMAARKAFDDLVGGLQSGSDEARSRFADDPDAIERHSLADLSERARQLADEVNTMPLPKQLIPAAEAVADASEILAEQADRAALGSIGDESLESLASADLERVAKAFEYASAQMAAVGAELGMDQQDVDGKGLYIR